MFRFMTFLLLFSVFSKSAQQNVRNCGMQEHMEKLMQDEQYRMQHQEKIKKLEALMKEGSETREDPSVITLPVAVHFQKLKGKNYDTECLKALAENQIQILNQDYGGYNLDISNWTQNASSAFPGVNNGESIIQFCIPTTGHPSGFNLNEGDPAVTFNQTIGDFDADWSGYINIFVRNISYLGYSPYGGNGNGDGVVIDDNAFGSGAGCGSISPGAPFDLGRTLTHELGHFLLLNHIWGTGTSTADNCNDSDNVSDTPNQSKAYGGCPDIGISTCGSADLHMNYMDYTYDECMYMFSAGQTSRMENYVVSNLQNVIANGEALCEGGTEPTCSDGIQNGDEEGVDCGGTICPDCPTGGCDVPSGLNALKQKGGQELLLNWSNVTAANSYDVQIRVPGGNWADYSTSSTSIVISGLSKKNTYEWRVRSSCSGGEVSNWSSIQTALTREIINSNEMEIYPNPAANLLTINLRDISTINDNLVVRSVTGQVIHIEKINKRSLIDLNVSDFEAGTYFISTMTNSGPEVKKFIVLNQ